MSNQQEGISDEFLEQILAYSDGGGFAGTGAGMVMGMMNSGGNVVPGSGSISGGSGFPGTVFPLGLSLEQGKGGFAKQEDASGSGNRFRDEQEGKRATAKTEREAVHFASLFPAFGHSQSQQHSLRPNTQQPYHAQTTTASVAVLPHPPVVRPRVRARRGQATDPHSIAERLRRERIAERMKQLQELVPNSNKTDRAAMLDDIVDYVKFLRLQVKVLSMSRLGGTGAVAQLVADIPLPTVEGEGGEGGSGSKERAWEKWSTDGTERQVAKLMEEDVGAAMQFLQSKALCIMPITLASAIYHTHQPDTHGLIKTEHNAPS